MYVIGASGTGKSTLLLNLILQNLERGEGVGVLDPHGDLVEKVMARLPEKRLDDVVFLDPTDLDHPVGFNILDAHSENEKVLLCSDLIAVFRRLSENWGDQMDAVFANAIVAFLESDRGGTLADLRRFLLDKAYREEFLTTVRDPDVVYFWKREFPLFSGRAQTPILTRLDHFLRPKSIRYMVGQRESRLDFRRIMDEGKVLLAKLTKGAMGERDAFLLGTLIVTKVQQLAMTRQDVDAGERRPFYLYVDEFHNFITPTMEEILSGGRKYGLSLTVAHQTLQQVAGRDQNVMTAVLTNPGVRIAFRVGEQDAKVIEKGFAAFDRDDLQRLGIGQAVVRVGQADCDFNLDTTDETRVDAETVQRRRNEIVARTRDRYGRPRDEVEALLREAAGVGPATIPEPHEDEALQPEAEVETKQPAPQTKKKPPRAPVAPPPKILPTAEPSPGRGGGQHKYLQELIKRWAEAREWRATIEEHILDGLGSVDVALRKADRSVACEISVSTTPEHELGNIQKCLAAGFERVVAISSERKTLIATKRLVDGALSEEQLSRVTFAMPDEAFAVLESIDAETATASGTIRGYAVKVKYSAVEKSEKNAKRQAVSGVIAKAMKRLKSTVD
jgi:hypothetical protein